MEINENRDNVISMNDDNNNGILLNNINEYNNNENINNNNNNLQNNRCNKIVLSVIIIVAIIISFFNFYNFVHIVNLIKRAYNILPQKVFEDCYLYPKYYELFVEFLSFFLGIDLILLTTIPLIDIYFDLEGILFKYSETFIFFNYLVFGPFLLGCLFLNLKYSNKLMYLCINFNPEKKIINFRLSFVFLFSLTISFLITFFGSIFFQNIYFSNSIKLNQRGNFVIGKIFWFFALKHSKRFNNAINSINLEEEILDNNEN